MPKIYWRRRRRLLLLIADVGAKLAALNDVTPRHQVVVGV